ncbi:MAG: BON domain-containing protein [Planctomycetota bacterium]|nr:BON domain-containing protein [Planctomycetota bacterium]
MPHHDAWLQKTISAHPSTANRASIRVEVKHGFVTLAGSAATYKQKERLHRFVMGLKGVRALKDLVRVWPIETIADRQIALHVRQALDAHAELPLGTASVHVRSGTVTLKGHVRSAEERVVAEHVTNHCRGVTSVLNELTVDPLDEIPDEATARAIHDALAYCKDFETGGIDVSCADGYVVLRGEVPSLMDRMLAEELARLQGGVRSVENHIHVEPPPVGAAKRR